MDFKTYLSTFVLLLTFFQVDQGGAILWSRRRRNPPPKSRPTAINCRPSEWSAWSDCEPDFCGHASERKRTRKVRDGTKCITKTEERDCAARGGCKQECNEKKRSCTCYSGYDILADGKTCTDIDECKSNEGRGLCSHKCKNTEGRYTCECNKGYYLVGDTSCKPYDCSTPQFSKCPSESPSDAEGRLPLCASIKTSCPNGTTYNSQCTLSCPKNYKLALKETLKWSDYKGFGMASSSIICSATSRDKTFWHAQLKDYYCRRSNDPPLAIYLADVTIKERMPPGSSIGRLSARDAQDGQKMVYSVKTHEGKSLFRCNGSVLETSRMFTWYPHEQNVYAVRIRAQDNGSPPMWREEVFNISVVNVNDPPRSIQISQSWVYENASVGTTVGKLSAIDDDLGSYRTSNFSWKLLGDDCGCFSITGNKVLVQEALDYDSRKICFIKVVCADLSSSTTKEIPIYVRNLIDPPTLSLRGNSIAENSKLGTVITQITSKSESNEDLSFMISETNPNATIKLGLSPRKVCEHHKNATKFNTTCYVNITVSGKLDYEETTDYTLQVYVRNSVSSNFIKWNISVENVNEKPDELVLNAMNEIPEDTQSGTDIGFFMVSDPDNRNDITQNHSCHVVNNVGDGEYFHVNNVKNSLQVKENKSLNYEKIQSYRLTVQCDDSGVPSLSVTREFIINVTDTDEPIQNLTLSNNKVPENSPVGAQIGTLDAYDPDIHLPKGMKFTLVDQEYPSFALRGVNNETLVVNGSLNFEENPDYVVTLRVTDTAGRHLQKTFSIKVIDVNEAPTDIILFTEYMNENQAAGSYISNITMVDEDENTVVMCELLEDGGGRIALNDTTLVAGEKNTDYERELSHVIEISLKCCDQLEACIKKKFNISVKDVNEPPTDIIIDNLQVAENEKDITIGRIIILDPDAYQEYTCHLTGDNTKQNSYLKIVNSNKTLRLIRELDFEKEQIIDFDVLCQEDGNSSMSLETNFDLTVIDVNEAPRGGCERPMYVSQKQTLGTVVGSLGVSDPDNANKKDICEPKQRLSYSIISQPQKLPFQILDGYVVKTDQVEEENTNYSITVLVRDDGVILARNLTKIYVKNKTTVFNCTIISRLVIGSQVTLSSNQVKEGSPNGSVIGYLGMETGEKDMKYELMEDQCNSYPFVVEGNKLMLMLSSSYPGPRTYKEHAPDYVMVRVQSYGENDTSTGHEMHTRFVIFINDDIKTHKLICFRGDPVRLSDISSTKLGPIKIYQENDTELDCPSENIPSSPGEYKCNVKPDLNVSSHGFSTVNLTNTLHVNKELFLTVNITVSEEAPGLDVLVVDLFCWEPARLFSFVKGKVQIFFEQKAQCEDDDQARDISLCENSKSCPKDTLCSTVVNAAKRCIPYGDQLFVAMPAFKNSQSLCEFENCLQEMLVGSKSECLSDWNERREKRATSSLYLDTLNITMLQKHNKLLLRAAVWEIQDGGELTLVKQLPKLQDSDGVTFFTTEKDCDLLEGQGIKCPVDNEIGNTGERSSTSLESPKMQAAVGVSAAILLIIIVVILIYCWRRKRKQNNEAKRNEPVQNFANHAFDNSELKQLPPVPREERSDNNLETKKKPKKGKEIFNFRNPTYEDPTGINSEDNQGHIYNEVCAPSVEIYQEPEQMDSHKENKLTKAISNPVYADTHAILIQKPQEDKSKNNHTNINYLREDISTGSKEHEYETLPHLQDTKVEKSGQELDANMQTTAGYALVNKHRQQETVGDRERCTATSKEPHYEELPLPDENQINKWKEQYGDTPARNKTEEESKSEPSKGSTYEDIPPLRKEKKGKGIFRFSKAFKNNDSKDSKQDLKTDRTNSTNSESDNFSGQDPIATQSMLNPREKVKRDDPANKYPFYEELPPIRDSKRTESFVAIQHGDQNVQKDGSLPSPVYHVLETSGNQEKSESGPRYFVLEKSNSTSDGNKKYQSLHRELDPPPPTYESYRLPQKSGTESGGQANEASSSDDINEK